MKQLPALLLLFCAAHALGQSTTMTTETEFRDIRKLYFFEESYIIEGRRVFGSPFLIHDWSTGTILTTDGRIFSGYQLKYDAFTQAVFFKNGGDSLEVNEPIKEFALVTRQPDTVLQARFIHCEQYKKEKKPFYYEVLLDNAAGQLLKVNKKIVADADKAMPAYEGRKLFELQTSFFFYDKNKKVIAPIRANGSNLAAILGLSDTEMKDLQLTSYDTSSEPGLRQLFSAYFLHIAKKQ